MPKLNVGQDLEKELKEFLEGFDELNSDNITSIIAYAKKNLQQGQTFEDLQKYLEERLNKSTKGSIKEKFIDVLCDPNVFENIPQKVVKVLENAPKVVSKDSKDDPSLLSFAERKKIVAELLKGSASTVKNEVENLRLVDKKTGQIAESIESGEPKKGKGKITLAIGTGATTLAALALSWWCFVARG